MRFFKTYLLLTFFFTIFLGGYIKLNSGSNYNLLFISGIIHLLLFVIFNINNCKKLFKVKS